MSPFNMGYFIGPAPGRVNIRPFRTLGGMFYQLKLSFYGFLEDFNLMGSLRNVAGHNISGPRDEPRHPVLPPEIQRQCSDTVPVKAMSIGTAIGLNISHTEIAVGNDQTRLQVQHTM